MLSHELSSIDDGSLRVYDLSTFKVLKAVKGLGSEVSSIICIKRPSSELRDAWVAHGKRVCLSLSNFVLLKFMCSNRFPCSGWTPLNWYNPQKMH